MRRVLNYPWGHDTVNAPLREMNQGACSFHRGPSAHRYDLLIKRDASASTRQPLLTGWA